MREERERQEGGPTRLTRAQFVSRFELAGFDVKAISIREGGKAIDRVNMYASFYRATLVRKEKR